MTVDINEWRNAAIPTISEFQRKMTLESRTLTIDCSLSYFENEILGNRIPGARYEYVNGFAEVTFYVSSIIHDAIGAINYDDWLRALPSRPELHNIPNDKGLDYIVYRMHNTGITYQEGATDSETHIFAPDQQFSSQLSPGFNKGSIIFEVAFSESLAHVRRKACEYLWSDIQPRSSVVVIFNCKKTNTSEDYIGMVVSFEVHRRGSAPQGGSKTFVKGFAHPRSKAQDPDNTQEIVFQLSELVGSLEEFDGACQLRDEIVKAGETLETLEQDLLDAEIALANLKNTPKGDATRSSAVDDLQLKTIIAGLHDGLLDTLRTLVHDKATTRFPISIVTRAIELSFRAQRQEKGAGTKRKRGSDLSYVEAPLEK